MTIPGDPNFNPAETRNFAVMGVVNVTPDSFSDAGLYFDPASAVEHGLALEGGGGSDPRCGRRVDEARSGSC